MTQLVIFISIVFVSQFSRMAGALTVTGFSIETFLLPLLFILLPMLPFVIPLAFFFGCITSFSQFSSQGGIVALAAAGVSFKRIYLPVGVVSIFLVIATYFSIHFLGPYGHRELDNFFVSRAQSSIDNFIKNKLQPGVFTDGFLEHIFYTESIDDTKQKMSNIFIIPRGNQTNEQENTFAVFAPKGELKGTVKSGDLGIELKNGTIHFYEDFQERLSVVKFDSIHVDLIKLFEKKLRTSKNYQNSRSLSTLKLRERVGVHHQAYLNTGKEDEDYKKIKKDYLTAIGDYYQRQFTPILVFIVGLYGFALGVVGQNRGRAQSVLVTVFFVIYLYAQVSLFRWLLMKGFGEPWLMSFLPHILSLIVVIFLIRRRVKKPLNETIFSLN